MRQNCSDLHLSPVIAAAATRRPRHSFLEKKSRKSRNNYVAETDLSHGKGSRKTGAPTGNRNALKHGRYSARRIAHRRHCRQLLHETEMLLSAMKSLRDGAKERI